MFAATSELQPQPAPVAPVECRHRQAACVIVTHAVQHLPLALWQRLPRLLAQCVPADFLDALRNEAGGLVGRGARVVHERSNLAQRGSGMERE